MALERGEREPLTEGDFRPGDLLDALLRRVPDSYWHTGNITKDDGVWTEARIRALGAVTDLPTAGRIFGARPVTARARPRNQAGLLADLEDHAQKGFVPQYMFDRPAGATETFGQASHRLLEEYGVPDLDFSVMKQSSALALYPHLDITREQR